MLTITTLKNIYRKDYYSFFKAHNVKDWRKRTDAKGDTAGYEAILKVINEELENGVSFSSDDLDSFLFENIYYINMNHQYVYRYDSFEFTKETNIERAQQFLADYPDLCLNKSLLDNIGEENFKLHTTRIESHDGKVTGIQLLLKIETIQTRRFPKQYMYAGVLIDTVNNFVVVKFNLSQLEKLHQEPLKLLEEIKKMLSSLNRYGRVFEPLNLNVISLNEEEARECIFKQFKELSLEAEKILEQYTSEDAEQKIIQFLKLMNIQEIADDYIQQIKAVIYQEISNTIKDSVFENGWIFRFVFREGITTRASSRTDDYGPIYGSKVYWHLKELILKENKLIEAGFHWYLPWNNERGGQDYVIVKLESRNETLIVNYYRKTRFMREEKERFVLGKINEHL